MKDNIDILIERSLQSDFEPDKEINEKILASAGHNSMKGKALNLPKAAAIIIAVISMSCAGVYAANQIIRKVFVTEHSISVGNSEYVDDAAIVSSEENVTTENVMHEEGNANVKWISKDVQIVNGYATNTYYAYKDYETAFTDAKMDNWFRIAYENAENVIYVITETEDTIDCCINANFIYKEGSFFVCEETIKGNLAEDAAHSILMENTNNQREYTSASGETFTLVDQITVDGDEEKTKTFVMVAYGDYFGYIAFENLDDGEIHEILDTVEVHR